MSEGNVLYYGEPDPLVSAIRPARPRGKKRTTWARACVAAVLLLSVAGASGALAEGTYTLTVATVDVLPGSGPSGTCPTQITVGFDRAGPTGPGFYNTGITQASVNGSTVTIDGHPAASYGTLVLYRANPPFDFIVVQLADSTVGAHALWIKSGTSGVTWEGQETTGTIDYGYLAADYTGSFTIPSCASTATPPPPPTATPLPTPTPTPTATPPPPPTATPLSTLKPTPKPTPATNPTARPVPATTPPSTTVIPAPSPTPSPTLGPSPSNTTATTAGASLISATPLPSTGAGIDSTPTTQTGPAGPIVPLPAVLIIGAAMLTAGLVAAWMVVSRSHRP